MKIGIAGTGFVGSTGAYAMIMQGIGREIILVDKNKARAKAEADDLFHAVPFSNPLTIKSGEYSDLAGCKAVVVSAGVSQRPGETRLQLLERNAAVFREVIPSILKYAPGTILVIATNPVDVMTYLAAKYAAEYGVPPNRIVGSGTALDTARFRTLIGEHIGVDPQHVHGYVLGEHGDSEVLTWSLVTVGGMPLESFCSLQKLTVDKDCRNQIDQKVRKAAYNIIEGKGATYYGIGSALARIVESILYDQRSILTLTTPVEEVAGVKDVAVSLPHLLGGDGILATFPLPLSGKEEQALNSSATAIKQAITAIT